MREAEKYLLIGSLLTLGGIADIAYGVVKLNERKRYRELGKGLVIGSEGKTKEQLEELMGMFVEDKMRKEAE